MPSKSVEADPKTTMVTVVNHAYIYALRLTGGEQGMAVYMSSGFMGSVLSKVKKVRDMG